MNTKHKSINMKKILTINAVQRIIEIFGLNKAIMNVIRDTKAIEPNPNRSDIKIYNL